MDKEQARQEALEMETRRKQSLILFLDMLTDLGRLVKPLIEREVKKELDRPLK